MKDKLQKIGLVFVASILGLALCEFLLAVPVYYFVKKNGETFYSRPHHHWYYVEDPNMGFLQAPNINVKRESRQKVSNAPRFKTWYDVQTDSNGFRYSSDLPKEKPEGEVRIFSFGGSTTFSAETSNAGTYPQQLEDMIGEPQIRVINNGVNGYRSIHLLLNYKHLVRDFDPDIITIYSGWNDYEEFMYSYWKHKDPHGHAFTSQMKMGKVPFADFALIWAGTRLYYRFSQYNRTIAQGPTEEAKKRYITVAGKNGWQEEYESNIQELITLAKADGVIPAIIIFPAPEFENATQEIKNFSDKDLNMAGRWDGVVLFLKNIRRIQTDLAHKNNIPLIDVSVEFEKLNNDYKAKFKLFTDKMHLTSEGNKLIAQTMLQPMKEIINEKFKALQEF